MGRKFGKRTFEHHKYRGSKKDAESDAKELRERGYYARVLPEGDGGHSVYKRKKRPTDKY